jgi:uncharacterized membrane protein YjjP (DUF1212 family)
MKSLQRALSDFVNEVTAGGPRSEALRKQLRDIQHRNTSYFVIPVVMLTVSFAAAMTLIIGGVGKTTGTAAIASLFGLSVIGMIRLMLSFWREKVATELMIELSELDDEVLRKVTARLLARMK